MARGVGVKLLIKHEAKERPDVPSAAEYRYQIDLCW